MAYAAKALGKGSGRGNGSAESGVPRRPSGQGVQPLESEPTASVSSSSAAGAATSGGGEHSRRVSKWPNSDDSASLGLAGSSPSAWSTNDQARRLSLGICCMASKASSQPMQAILRRLDMCGNFETVIFPEETILNRPPSEWPITECLIAFFSKGFPLDKCIEYCRLRTPRCINNVEAQDVLKSRVGVYKTLQEWCIPCPDHVIVDHLALPEDSDDLVETDNFIIYKGKKIVKPFVEKPEDGDRHDIWIYYPRSIGGGAKKLFRKVKNQSSDFDPNQNTIRRDGTYIYEPFLPTQGTDIKVYTVGAGYVHAEARKAPTVDGKVNRSKDGKEVRYPVVLTQGEKAIAAFIVKAFRQNICGFDILRTDGGSVVCDVNGWSFVKGNQKYYNDCATLIRKHLLEECGVSGVDTSTMMILGPGDESITPHMGEELSNLDYSVRESLVSCSKERLRSVIVVMRHGDRRPKEKLKFKTKLAPILAYFESVPADTAEVKLKTPEELSTLKSRLEECARGLRKQLANMQGGGEDPALDVGFLRQESTAGDEGKKSEEKRQAISEELLNIDLFIPVLELKDRFSGLERKVQLKATKWKQPKDEESSRKAAQVQVVAKWGGELTVHGLAQAKELGYRLRHDLYPNDPTGLLRLHSSFRHDFKIYSSQEGRCQITAAAFTKGFLDLDGDIIPILVSLVTRESFAQGLLDEPIPKKERDAVKQKIESLLLSYDNLDSSESACPTDHTGLLEAAQRIGSPLQLLHTIRYLTAEYIDSISAWKEKTYEEMRKHWLSSGDHASEEQEDCHDDAVPLGQQVVLGPGPQIPEDLKDSYKRKWLHLRRKELRWRKLFSGFAKMKDEKGSLSDDANFSYDASKIPDVWDNLYYDMLTHRQYLGERSCRIAEMMVGLLHPLNEWVCLSEYGLSAEEKLRIGVDVTWRLIGKMLNDLEFMIEDNVGTIDEAGKHAADKDQGETQALISEGVRRTTSGLSSASRGVGNIPSGPSSASSPPHPGPAGQPQDPPSPGLPSVTSNSAKDGHASPAMPWNDGPVRTTSNRGEWKAMCSSEDPSETSPPTNMISVAGSTPPLPDGETERRASETSDHVFQLEIEESPPMQTVSAPPSSKDNGSSSNVEKKKPKTPLTKLTPEVRNELKQALRDSSDWHPRLNDSVRELTDLKKVGIVRSRIYVTSASTMHSLFNILRHGQNASEGEKIVSDLSDVMDLNYLTHLVLRCYERDDTEEQAAERERAAQDFDPSVSPAEHRKLVEKARYRVEISMSPGVQVFKDGRRCLWPKGEELNENTCMVAPLEIIGDDIDLSRLEKFLAAAVKEYGPAHEDDSSADEMPSGMDD